MDDYEEPKDNAIQVSMLLVERYLAQELNPEEKLSFEKLIKADKNLRDLVESAKKEKIPFTFQDLQNKITSQKSPLSQKQVMGPASWFERVQATLFQKPQRLAFAAILLLGVFVYYQSRRNVGNEPRSEAFLSKGETGFYLYFESQKLVAGKHDTIFVNPGDTLSFIYRNKSDFFVQVWYRDDGAELYAYLTDNEASKKIPPSTSWNLYDDKIVLNESWGIEELMIVYSENDLSAKSAKDLILGAKQPSKGTHLLRYVLRNRKIL